MAEVNKTEFLATKYKTFCCYTKYRLSCRTVTNSAEFLTTIRIFTSDLPTLKQKYHTIDIIQFIITPKKNWNSHKGILDLYSFRLILHIIPAHQKVFPRCPYPLMDFECSSNYLKGSKPGATNRFVFASQTYDHFMSKDSGLRPSLVLALNCGFIFYQEWDRWAFINHVEQNSTKYWYNPSSSKTTWSKWKWRRRWRTWNAISFAYTINECEWICTNIKSATWI